MHIIIQIDILFTFRSCFFSADVINNKQKFLYQLNMSFGSGGMTSGLDSTQLIEYFQTLQRVCQSLPIKKAVLYTGMQADGSCVLNEETFVSAEGTLISPEDSGLIWLNKDLIYENDKVKSTDIAPHIIHPLSDEPLKDLVLILKKVAKHNFYPALGVVAAVIMSFHYKIIKERHGGCPIAVAMGESETGKSTAIRTALGLFGCHQIGRYVKGTNAIFLERSSKSSIPFGIEEAMPSTKAHSNKLDLGELVIDLYDGAISANMKSGIVKPKSAPIIATNFKVEEIARYVMLLLK